MQPSQVHVNKALENISVAYMPQGLVAQDVSPIVPVEKESDIYYVYSKDNLRIPHTIWADGDTVNRSVWNVSTSTYQLTRHGLDDLVTDRQRANADKAIKPDIDMTEALTGQIKLRWEFDLFSIINTLTNWANRTSLSSTQAWTQNTTLSNPINFVDSATTSIRRRSGKKANTIVLSDSTFKAAKEHVSIVDRIKYTSADSVTPGMLAGLFNVGKVVVSEAVKNDADEGIADSLSDMATDTAGIFYVEPSPGLKKPSAFYTFVKNGMSNPWRVRTYRDEPREGDVIEVSTFFQHKVVSSDCAYIINNCE